MYPIATKRLGAALDGRASPSSDFTQINEQGTRQSARFSDVQGPSEPSSLLSISDSSTGVSQMYLDLCIKSLWKTGHLSLERIIDEKEQKQFIP